MHLLQQLYFYGGEKDLRFESIPKLKKTWLCLIKIYLF